MSFQAKVLGLDMRGGDCFQQAALKLRKAPQALLVVSAVWLFIASLSIWNYTWDDSYIIFRYAENLRRGLGVVFNPGQRVEGYTSFLWVLMLAGAAKLFSNPVFVSKVLGVLLNLGALLASYFLCRQAARDVAPVYGVALLLAATNTHFIVGSVAGLETPLFTALLCWSLVAYLKAVRATDPRGQARWWAGGSLLLALLVMTRPDGALTYGLLWLYALWSSRKRPRNLAFFTLPFLLAYTPYFLWRWDYYGLLFPNTFYVKRGGTLALLARGATQTGSFLADQTGGWFLGGLVGLAALFLPVVETTVLALAIASRLIFEVWSGGVTPGEFRFLIPALPLIWILTERVLAGWLTALGKGARGLLLPAGVCTVLLAAQVAVFIQFRKHHVAPVEAGMEHAHIALGRWLNAHTPADTLVAVGDIGAIGFFSHRRVLDLDGLTDTHISHLPGGYGGRRDSLYVLRQAPEFIVLRTSSCSPGRLDVPFAMDKAIYSDPQFHREYDPANCWEFWPRYDLIVYQRIRTGGSTSPTVWP